MRKYKYLDLNAKRINELNLNNDIKFIEWKQNNPVIYKDEEESWINYCEENKIHYNFSLFHEVVLVIICGGYNCYKEWIRNI